MRKIFIIVCTCMLFVFGIHGQELAPKQITDLNLVTGETAIKLKTREILQEKGKAKEILESAKAVLKSSPGKLNGNALWILAKVAQESRDIDATIGFHEAYIKDATRLASGQRLAAGYGAYIQILFDAKKYKECEKACSDFLDITLEDESSFLAVLRLKPVVFRRMVLCQSRLGQPEKGLEKVEKLIKDQPENWLNLELKGRILREAGRSQDAEKAYEELLEKIKTDKRLGKEEKEDFLEEVSYTLSNVYVDLKKIDKAAGVLEKLIEKNQDNSTYLNDLGYILADNNLRLDDAEKMVRKAIDLDREQRKKIKNLKPSDDRDNSAYLDSLAWVLYKKKNFAEAKKLLLEAIKDVDGQHIEILDHLADIHEALGEKDDALRVWKQGLESATPSKRDQEKKADVEKKIKRLSGK